MSEQRFKDRDKAVTYAMGQASALLTPFMVYQSITDRLWRVCLYPNMPEGDAINPSVRYVLPMGEVTRLS